MAEWKTQLNYKYNPPYHAYAYGLMYQPGNEQNHRHVTGWGEAGPPEFNNYTPGVAQIYYAATAARTPGESPPHSPEQHVASGYCHYQGSSVVCLGQSQVDRSLRVATDDENRRAGSDSTSDSEAHASPDSWSFSSSRESGLPQADPTTWVKKELCEDANSRIPDTGDQVSSSLMGELSSCTDMGSQNDNVLPLQAPLPTLKIPRTNAKILKGKVRVVFSKSQMNALVQRFSVQRYLTPAEMNNLAEMTGLTYKQVKTWFQNRRMKLRRHQKDNNWVSARYSRRQASLISGTVITHPPAYQAEAQRPPPNECYNHHTMEAPFKNSAPQNLAFYLATMGSTAASTPYPTWSSGTPQAVMPTRSQAVGWSMPTGINQYKCNPGVFHPTGNTEPDNSFDRKDKECVTTQNSSHCT
ncbi:homeobox protein NANOG [Syngnathoides biaculeatus]|uniref:homeobox protein NANOG n=1 Tax=Syngnathoides biaculeatus TaxID=300417 RepID=UPI002ADDFAB4|nr:homeobox protein NANOG [Syngnathoides biaculeatus]